MSLYSPDRAFTKRMKAIDPKLTVRWNPGLKRWQIFRMVRRSKPVCDNISMMYDSPFHVLTVAYEDKSFMPLDDRTIKRLHEIDSWRLNRYAKTVDELEAIAEAAEAKGEKERDYQLDELTGEMADDASRVKLSEWER